MSDIFGWNVLHFKIIIQQNYAPLLKSVCSVSGYAFFRAKNSQQGFVVSLIYGIFWLHKWLPNFLFQFENSFFLPPKVIWMHELLALLIHLQVYGEVLLLIHNHLHLMPQSIPSVDQSVPVLNLMAGIS